MGEYGVIFRLPRGKFKVKTDEDGNEFVEFRIRLCLTPDEIKKVRVAAEESLHQSRSDDFKSEQQAYQKALVEAGEDADIYEPIDYDYDDPQCYAGSDMQVRHWLSEVAYASVIDKLDPLCKAAQKRRLELDLCIAKNRADIESRKDK